MHQPELLILDEPTSGLDPLVQQEFHGMVREARHRGQTIFLSSHVLSEIQQTADTVGILRDGRIIAVESVGGLQAGAIRRIRLTASTASGLTADDAVALLAEVPGVGQVQVLESDGGVTLAAVLEGAIQPLVRTLGQLPLTDLVIGEPDLEEAVLKLYEGGQEEPR